eukprot:g1861.t1
MEARLCSAVVLVCCLLPKLAAGSSCSEAVALNCESLCEGGEKYDNVNPRCPGLIVKPVEGVWNEVQESNLRADFRIRQLTRTGSGGCTYTAVCSHLADPRLATICLDEVQKKLKLRTEVSGESTKIPHYSREVDLIPTYGSKYRAARLYTTHPVHIRVTLVLQVSSITVASALIHQIGNVTEQLTALKAMLDPPSSQNATDLYDSTILPTVGIFLMGGRDRLIKVTDYIKPSDAYTAAAASLQALVESESVFTGTNVYGAVIDAVDFVAAAEHFSSFTSYPTACEIHKPELYDSLLLVSDNIEKKQLRTKVEMLQTLRSAPVKMKVLFADTYDTNGEPADRIASHDSLLADLESIGSGKTAPLSPTSTPTQFSFADGCVALKTCNGYSAAGSCFCDQQCASCYTGSGTNFDRDCAKTNQCCDDFTDACAPSAFGTATASPTPAPTVAPTVLGHEAVRNVLVFRPRAGSAGGTTETLQLAMQNLTEWTKTNVQAKQRHQALQAPTATIVCTTSSAPSQKLCVSGEEVTRDINYRIGNPDKCGIDKWKKAQEYLSTAEGIYFQNEDGKRPTFAGKGTHLFFDMTSWYPIPEAMRKYKQPIAFATPSQEFGGGSPGVDISWPAKNLVDFFEDSDVDCTKNKYLLAFKGTDDHPTRKKLGALHNGKDVQIILQSNKVPCVDTENEDTLGQALCGTGAYKDLLTNTRFGAVVRGDTYYSYRFLEVMSAGAIPVILSDRWALPFHEVLDYESFAVLAREQDVGKLTDSLRAIPDERVCEMRKEARRVYAQHFATFDAQVETAMQIFDARSAGTARKPPLDWTAICATGENDPGGYQCQY